MRHKNTIDFMFWATNHCVPAMPQERPIWFRAVWGSYLGEHLHHKWEKREPHYKTSTDAMLTWFFFELSSDNQELLLEWVSNNYSYTTGMKWAPSPIYAIENALSGYVFTYCEEGEIESYVKLREVQGYIINVRKLEK